MLIKNVYLVGAKNNIMDIGTRGKIISANYTDDLELDFNGAIAFPGIINSHDHLEFNLYPLLGNKKYEDYVQWGTDIHLGNKEIIDKTKAVPYDLRFRWGLYKNLLCGVTSVAHHGNGAILRYIGMPDIIQNYNYLHSVRLEKRWKIKLNIPLNGNPFVIHTGEGTNNKSREEVNELIKWNLTARKIIGVHGISITPENVGKFMALVWCPDSNLFLYNKTANISELKNGTDILFGTDSSLSSDWNIWNHLRLARSLGYLFDNELYDSLFGTPSKTWALSGTGSVSENKNADIVLAQRVSENIFDSFYNTNPENILLILKGGAIVFLDKYYEDNFGIIDEAKYDLIEINNVRKYVVKGLKDVVESIHTYMPEYKFPFSVF